MNRTPTEQQRRYKELKQLYAVRLESYLLAGRDRDVAMALFKLGHLATDCELYAEAIRHYELALERLDPEQHAKEIVQVLKLLASLAQRLERTSQNHAQALARLHEIQRTVSANEAAVKEQSERMSELEKQNEELKENIETLQELLDRKQKEIDELSQKGGLFGRRKKR